MTHRSARSCAWKADELDTVGVCVQLAMAVVGWMRTGMEIMVVGRHAGQGQGVGRMSGDAGAFPECDVNTLIAPGRTTIQVPSSGQGRAGIGLSS